MTEQEKTSAVVEETREAVDTTSQPVSYTHLDVYKRQVHDHQPSQSDRTAAG